MFINSTLLSICRQLVTNVLETSWQVAYEEKENPLKSGSFVFENTVVIGLWSTKSPPAKILGETSCVGWGSKRIGFPITVFIAFYFFLVHQTPAVQKDYLLSVFRISCISDGSNRMCYNIASSKIQFASPGDFFISTIGSKINDNWHVKTGYPRKFEKVLFLKLTFLVIYFLTSNNSWHLANFDYFITVQPRIHSPHFL